MIDTRKYQWMIGGFGLLLVAIFSVYLYSHGNSNGPGVDATMIPLVVGVQYRF